MSSYLITYDLFRPGQNYDGLWRALTAIGACRIMLSVWVLRSELSVAQLYDYLVQFIDGDDRIVVVGAPILHAMGWVDADKLACGDKVLN